MKWIVKKYNGPTFEQRMLGAIMSNAIRLDVVNNIGSPIKAKFLKDSVEIDMYDTVGVVKKTYKDHVIDGESIYLFFKD